MNSNSMNIVFDLIELTAGLYLIFNGVRMKMTGRIEGNGLIGRNINLLTARDKAGFIKAMFPAYIVCGALFAILGGTVAVFDYQGAELPQYIYTAVTGALLLICAVLAILTKRAQEKYLI